MIQFDHMFQGWNHPDLHHLDEKKLDGGFKYVFIFTPNLGEDESILTHIFQLAWNHQLENPVFFPRQTWVMVPIQEPIAASTGWPWGLSQWGFFFSPRLLGGEGLHLPGKPQSNEIQNPWNLTALTPEV